MGNTAESGDSAVNGRVDDRLVELRVPAEYSFASTVRLVAASLAADANFSVDDVDDLRLAVNEVFASAVVALEHASGSTAPGAITVCYRSLPVGIDVEVTALRPGTVIVLDELAESIIRSAVDEFTVNSSTVLLRKRQSG
jgi:serine/threonine-protein kinase RsbW